MFSRSVRWKSVGSCGMSPICLMQRRLRHRLGCRRRRRGSCRLCGSYRRRIRLTSVDLPEPGVPHEADPLAGRGAVKLKRPRTPRTLGVGTRRSRPPAGSLHGARPAGPRQAASFTSCACTIVRTPFSMFPTYSKNSMKRRPRFRASAMMSSAMLVLMTNVNRRRSGARFQSSRENQSVPTLSVERRHVLKPPDALRVPVRRPGGTDLGFQVAGRCTVARRRRRPNRRTLEMLLS
jgi:hypothetical protein